MNRLRLLALALLIAAGCGKTDPVLAPEDSPLTVEQWKALPTEQKHEAATFERLKAGDPKLRDERAWEKFTRDVLLPAKKRDFLGGAKR